MGDHTASTTVYPSGNDLFKSGGASGDGKGLREERAAELLRALSNNHVLSGLLVPGSSGNLNIVIPLGKALVYGHWLDIEATTVTAAASSTNHVFLKVTLDGNDRISLVEYEVNTSGTPPANSTKIATLITDADNITSTTDERLLDYITEDMLRTDSVTAQQIATDAVTTPKIKDANVTKAKLTTEALGLHVIARDVTETTINASTVETTVFTVSIPGGTLSTNKGLRITIIGHGTVNNFAGVSAKVRVKYGGTTIHDSDGTTLTQTSDIFGVKTVVELHAQNATGAQRAVGQTVFGDSSGSATQGLGRVAGVRKLSRHSAVAVNSAAAQTLEVTWQWSSSASGINATVYSTMVEVYEA